MSTFDVIKRSTAGGKNMVITHEPTFWLGNDDIKKQVDSADLDFTPDPIQQRV